MIERGHGYNRNPGMSLGGNVASSNNNNNNTRTSFMVTPPLAPLGMESTDQVHNPKQQRGFFSLFSRFGAKNRSLSRINTKSGDFPRLEASGTSVPNTPITPMAPTTPHPHVKHSLSLPIFTSQQFSRNSDPALLSPTHATWEQIPFWDSCARAIRAGPLAATTLSMETILRRNQERSQEQKEEGTRSRRGRYLQRSHASTKSVDLDWTTKLFVLVEGSLLQYAGDGASDRTPEKALQLTASSVAFASDVIPGRPWVLQVYQSAGPDGSLLPMPERRGSFISKITFKGTVKSPATSLLLVFDGAEEMDAWMGAIRAEAVRLGGGNTTGQERETEDIEEEAEQTDDESDNRHSRRYIIERDNDLQRHESSSDETASKRTSTTYFRRPSTEAGRSFTTVTSNDQMMLDQLRGSRLSMQSVADTKVSTVSPDTSPDRSSSTKHKRRSTATASARSRSSVELISSSLRPLSAIDRDGNLYWIPRTPSPSATNFSLPLSNAQQQPPRRSTIPMSQPIPIPHLPTPPLSNRPSLSALSIVDSLPDTPPYPLPRQRHRQSSHSTPASPKLVSHPIRPRPVSMVDTRSTPSPSPEVPISKSPAPRKSSQAGIAIPPRQKSLRRKSMTAIGPSAGPPLHPPPSIPLPQLPPEPYNDDLYSSSLPSTSYLFSGPPHRRLPPPKFHQQAPKPQPQLNAYRSLGSRHSFHGVRKDRYV